MPEANVSSTKRIFSAALQRKRRCTPFMIWARLMVLLIRSVINIILAKRDALAGQVGGNHSCDSRHSDHYREPGSAARVHRCESGGSRPLST